MATIADALDAKLGNENKNMTIVEALGGLNGETIADVIARSDKFVEPETETEPVVKPEPEPEGE